MLQAYAENDATPIFYVVYLTLTLYFGSNIVRLFHYNSYFKNHTSLLLAFCHIILIFPEFQQRKNQRALCV